MTDGDRVLQIITNLLANAFRWTPERRKRRRSLLSTENGNIHVAVEDTGPGIGPEEQDRIFRPFWTHDGKGTGLGLAIARELAMALGGPDRPRQRGRARQQVRARAADAAGRARLAGFALFEPVDLGAAAGVAACARCARGGRRCRSSRTRSGRRAARGRRSARAARQGDRPRAPRAGGSSARRARAPRRAAGDRSRLGADALANRFLDPPGKRRLELGGDLRQLLDLPSRTLEGRFDVAERRTASGRALQPLSRPCDRRFFHGRDASVRVG